MDTINKAPLSTLKPHHPKPEGSPLTNVEMEAIACFCIARVASQYASFAHPSIKTSTDLGRLMKAAQRIEQQMIQQARASYLSSTGRELPNDFGTY